MATIKPIQNASWMKTTAEEQLGKHTYKINLTLTYFINILNLTNLEAADQLKLFCSLEKKVENAGSGLIGVCYNKI